MTTNYRWRSSSEVNQVDTVQLSEVSYADSPTAHHQLPVFHTSSASVDDNDTSPSSYRPTPNIDHVKIAVHQPSHTVPATGAPASPLPLPPSSPMPLIPIASQSPISLLSLPSPLTSPQHRHDSMSADSAPPLLYALQPIPPSPRKGDYGDDATCWVKLGCVCAIIIPLIGCLTWMLTLRAPSRSSRKRWGNYACGVALVISACVLILWTSRR